VKLESDFSQWCELEVESMTAAGTQETPMAYKQTSYYDEGG